MGHYPHFTTRRWPGGSQKTLRLHMGIALACERAVSQKEPAHAAHVSFLNRRLFHGRAGTSYPSRSARRDDAPYRSLYIRSEEHTSELQSLIRSSYAVFCLKKKTM